MTIEEVEQIETLDLEAHSQIWHICNVWLFAFYLAGIRIADVVQMKWAGIQDGRLLYVMNKNNKPVSFGLPDKAKTILEYYGHRKSEGLAFIFPYMDKADLQHKRDIHVKTKTKNASRLMNKYLKRIAEQCGI